MLKRFPSRNQRSKGVRVKHVLQIFFLVGICFWLVYQVKHSHDKKKEFDGNVVKSSSMIRRESENDNEIVRLGRKDLPREDITQIEKPGEEEEEEVAVTEEEEKHEEERDEIERKREDEEEENKNEEVVTEDGGNGDDEIDENDQERKDEDFVDEDKDQDEEVDEESRAIENTEEVGDQTENESEIASEDQSYHEAREENYRADDASSEVTHEAHDVLNKEIKVITEISDENLVASDLNNTKNVNENAEDGLNSGSIVQKVGNSSSDLVDKQLLETTQTGNNSVPVSTDSTNGSATKFDNSTVEVSTEVINGSIGRRNETSDPSLQSTHEEAVSDSGHDAKNTTSGDNKGDQTALLEQTNNSTVSSENEKVDPNPAILSVTENRVEPSKESSDSSNKTTKTEASRADETTQVKSDETRDENSEENQSNDEESTGETDTAIQDDPIDSSDTQITEEDRTDLDALPELTSQGDEIEEDEAAAAE